MSQALRQATAGTSTARTRIAAGRDSSHSVSRSALAGPGISRATPATGATRPVFLAALRLRLLSASGADVPAVAVLFDNFPARPVIVAGVQAQVLWLGLGRLWALNHDRLDCLGQQQVVVDVGWGDDDSQRPSLTIDQQGFFEPHLPRSVGLGPILSPPLRALPKAPSAACHRQ